MSAANSIYTSYITQRHVIRFLSFQNHCIIYFYCVAIEFLELPHSTLTSSFLYIAFSIQTMPATSRARTIRKARTAPKVATSSNDQALVKFEGSRDVPPIRKSHSRRHRHQFVEESSSGPKSDEGSRVSLVHYDQDDKPYHTFHKKFRAVNIKYFKQIFFGTFRPEQSIELSRTPYNRMDNHKDVPEATDLIQLLRCFEVYGQAICHYAHSDVVIQLQEALSDYRVRLIDLSVYYTFDSIREYHYAFMYARILNGQDDPISWTAEDESCRNVLIRKDLVRDDTQYPGSPDESF